jgi:hypothetical protein
LTILLLNAPGCKSDKAKLLISKLQVVSNIRTCNPHSVYVATGFSACCKADIDEANTNTVFVCQLHGGFKEAMGFLLWATILVSKGTSETWI